MTWMTKDWTMGQLNALVKNVGGEDVARAILAGKAKVSVVMNSLAEFAVWKTIRIGTGLTTADDFRQALKKANMRISDWGNDILGKFAFTTNETEIELDLVNISVAELGFKQGVARRDIIAKALEFGLELCPAEVGPALRLQYADQPRGGWLLIAMEPITDSDGRPLVFSVKHDDGGLWLSGRGIPDSVWDADDRFVFVRPRK